MRLRPDQNVVLPSFIVQVLSTSGAADQLLLDSVGSTMDNLNTKTLSNLLLPVPPLGEQKTIIKYLKQQTESLDNLIEKVDISIDEMTKKRQALITAAVTGKIDVREEIKSDRGVA
jgi:restriction endonuclease S subunit